MASPKPKSVIPPSASPSLTAGQFPSFQPLNLPSLDFSLSKGTNIPAPAPSPPVSVHKPEPVSASLVTATLPAGARNSMSKQSIMTASTVSKRAGVRAFFSRLVGSRSSTLPATGAAAAAGSAPAGSSPAASATSPPPPPPAAGVVGSGPGSVSDGVAAVDSSGSSTVGPRRRSLLPFLSNSQVNLQQRSEQSRAMPPPPAIPEDVLWGVVSPHSRGSVADDRRPEGGLDTVPEAEVGTSLGIDTDELFRKVS